MMNEITRRTFAKLMTALTTIPPFDNVAPPHPAPVTWLRGENSITIDESGYYRVAFSSVFYSVSPSAYYDYRVRLNDGRLIFYGYGLTDNLAGIKKGLTRMGDFSLDAQDIITVQFQCILRFPDTSAISHEREIYYEHEIHSERDDSNAIVLIDPLLQAYKIGE